MRKIIAPVLVGLGAFLLIIGILGLTWVPGAVKKTPLDVNTVTRLEGEGAKINTEGELVTKPIYAMNVTQVDTKASSDDIAVFAEWSCAAFVSGDCIDEKNPNKVLVGSEDDLITADYDIFGSDRVTGLSVDEKDLPKAAVDAGATDRDGLVNKFPFDTKKKTYAYWDGTLGAAVDATFDRTEKIDGFETYVFKVEVDKAEIDVAEDTPGTYSSSKELFIDAATGAIVNQTEKQQRWLEDGTQVLEISYGFTGDQVEKNVKEAKSNNSKLNLLTKVVPIVGLLGGILLLGGGLVLGRRREQDTNAAPARSLASK